MPSKPSVITDIQQQYPATVRYALETNLGASVQYELDVIIGVTSNQVGPYGILTDDLMKVAGLVLGQPYQSSFYNELDVNAILCEMNLSRIENSPNAWKLKCVYRNMDPNYNPGPNPFDCAPFVETETLPYQVPLVYDRDGNAVLNSAGDAFESPPERDQYRTVTKITVNQVSYDDQYARSLQDNINNDSFAGADPRTLKIAKITSVPHWAAGYGQVWRTTYEIHYDPKGWTRKILDMGYKQIDDSSGQLVPILLKDGSKPSSACMLDGSGHYIPDPTPNDAVQLEFHVYNEISFASLGLGTVNFGGGWG
jgi:hypothetical protein